LACFTAITAAVLVPRIARADDDTTQDTDSTKDGAQTPSPSGFEAGLRLGYALPMGPISGASTSPSMNDLYNGAVPIWIDAGVRTSPSFYIGGFFQYGVAVTGSAATATSTASCNSPGMSCSGSVVMAGVDAIYHVAPDQTFDPWLGVGVGYEWANFSATQGSSSAGLQLSGFQFVNLQLGGDVRGSRNFAWGPYAMFSVGQYSNYSGSDAAAGAGSGSLPQQALHEWLSFGVRATFDASP
jgi:outer membrane protein